MEEMVDQIALSDLPASFHLKIKNILEKRVYIRRGELGEIGIKHRIITFLVLDPSAYSRSGKVSQDENLKPQR